MVYNKKLNRFIEKSNIKHGNKYDYRLVEYVNSKTYVIISCPLHKDFKQRPDHHISGSGCQKCSKNYRYSDSEFIEISKTIHGNKYDYSLVDYINSHVKVSIRCKTHNHIFNITPNGHISRKEGCPLCFNENRFMTHMLETMSKY